MQVVCDSKGNVRLKDKKPKGVKYTPDRRYLLVEWSLRRYEEGTEELWEWIDFQVDSKGTGVILVNSPLPT